MGGLDNGGVFEFSFVVRWGFKRGVEFVVGVVFKGIRLGNYEVCLKFIV